MPISLWTETRPEEGRDIAPHILPIHLLEPPVDDFSPVRLDLFDHPRSRLPQCIGEQHEVRLGPFGAAFRGEVQIFGVAGNPADEPQGRAPPLKASGKHARFAHVEELYFLCQNWGPR